MIEALFQFLHRLKKTFFKNLDFAKIPFIRHVRRFIIRALRKNQVAGVNGYTMFVDDKDSLSLSWHRIYEPGTTNFFKQHVRPGSVIVDIGANIGYFTLLFSGLAGVNGHVYAFEPDPANIKLLKKNIAFNNLKNVTVIEKAVAEKTMTMHLYLSAVNKGNHQMFDTGERRNRIAVEAVALDDYFPADIKIDFIKMDVEGFESTALKGMKNFLMNQKNAVIVTELFPDALTAGGSSVKELTDLLSQSGFMFSLIDERKGTLARITKEEITKTFSTGSRPVNVLCERENAE